MRSNERQAEALQTNCSLRRWFARRGLELKRVWRPGSRDLDIQNWQLDHLRSWVVVWEQLGDREELELLGFCYPPLGIGVDADHDWRRFEGWLTHQRAIALG